MTISYEKKSHNLVYSLNEQDVDFLARRLMHSKEFQKWQEETKSTDIEQSVISY